MKLALSHIVATLMVLCAVVLHVMADNPDAPNLDFSHGNFDNWRLFVGGYSADAETSDNYSYDWTEIEQSSRYVTTDKRMMLINTVDQNDPVVACSEFYTNPFAGSIVTRIGVPVKTEGMRNAGERCDNRWNTHRAAATERMEYSYVVTEGSSILRYDFAAVLNVPDNSQHSGNQLPYFGIKVEVSDDATGDTYVVPCGSYETNANESTSSLLHNKPIYQCRSSIGGASAGNYVYRPWTNGTIDLRDFIGKKVTITITTHDCIVACDCVYSYGCSGVYNVAGGHESYAYFRAMATSVSLQTSNCGEDDGIITAPEGYASYTWSRSDGLNATGIVPTAVPNQVRVPRSTMKSGVIYKCVLSDEMGCANIEITSELNPVNITPGFDYENHCGGEISFTENSVSDGDVINRWQWDFGDGGYSFDRNPVHTYSEAGDYNVSLIVYTENGCTRTLSKKVSVRFFPKLEINASSPICKGSEFMIGVTGTESGSSYKWFNSDMTEISEQQMFTTIADKSQTYYVSVTDPNSCVYQSQYAVTVQIPSQVAIIGDYMVCPGASVLLTAVGAAKYEWDGMEETSSQVLVSPVSQRTYKVTGTDAVGCKSEAVHTVDLYDRPEISISGEESFCEGQSVLWTLSGAEKYYWDDYNSESERMISVARDYTVVGIDAKGCESLPVTKPLKESPKPDITVEGDVEICQGERVLLLAKGVEDVKWRTSADVNAPVEETSLYMDSVLQKSVTFYVFGSNGVCDSKIAVPVVVHPTPRIKVAQNVEAVCLGDIAHLSVSGASKYKWINTSYTDAEVDVKPSISTNYRVVGYSEYECVSDTSVIAVKVNPLPVVGIEGDRNVCYGGMATLTAVGDASEYQWDNGSTGAKVSVLIDDETNVYVTAFSEYGCKSTATHTVIPVELPDLRIDGRTEGCVGDTLTLVGAGAEEYLWPDGSTEPVFRMGLEQNTNVTLYGSLKNCKNSIVVPVRAYVPPTLIVSSDTLVCSDSEFELTASGADSYEWNTGDVGHTIKTKVNAPTKYVVKGSSGGCSTTRSVNVALLPSPAVSLKLEDFGVCPYRNDSILVGATGADYYEWSSNPSNPLIEKVRSHLLRTDIDGDTWIYCKGYNEHECFGVDSIEIKNLPEPKFSYSIEPVWIDKSNSEVRFTGIEPGEGTSWYWNTGDGSPVLSSGDITYQYDFERLTDDVTISVTAVDRHNCRFSANVPLRVWKEIWSPTAFSPNGDGLNDTFRFRGGEFIVEFDFYIYNRLGEIVYEGRSIDDEWDGKYNGKLCPWGVYGWVANYKAVIDGLERIGELKGQVSIVK